MGVSRLRRALRACNLFLFGLPTTQPWAPEAEARKARQRKSPAPRILNADPQQGLRITTKCPAVPFKAPWKLQHPALPKWPIIGFRVKGFRGLGCLNRHFPRLRAPLKLLLLSGAACRKRPSTTRSFESCARKQRLSSRWRPARNRFF